MATERTKAQTAVLVSRYAGRRMALVPLDKDPAKNQQERSELLTQPASQRPVRQTFKSADGRLYASDGISIRRIR